MLKKRNILKESGQIVIIVLLASALVLTLGMSMSKKTVTETRIDSDEELLKQAFNTAESGIEYYLATGETTYGSGNGTANVSVSTIGESNNLSSDGAVLSGKPFLFWLVDHNSDDSISSDSDDRFSGTISEICVDGGFNGALKVDLFTFGIGETHSVDRFGYNMNGSSIVNGFDSIADECTGPIIVNGGMLLAVTPIGDSSNITIESASNFPAQGEEIVSVGEMDNGVNTKVKVINRYQVPVFMLESISSGNSVLSQ